MSEPLTCGCCKRGFTPSEIGQLFCLDCDEHVLQSSGLRLHERTYEAATGKPCPFTPPADVRLEGREIFVPFGELLRRRSPEPDRPPPFYGIDSPRHGRRIHVQVSPEEVRQYMLAPTGGAGELTQMWINSVHVTSVTDVEIRLYWHRNGLAKELTLDMTAHHLVPARLTSPDDRWIITYPVPGEDYAFVIDAAPLRSLHFSGPPRTMLTWRIISFKQVALGDLPDNLIEQLRRS